MVRAACPHDCPDTCAMRITVEDGRVQRVEGEPEHPPTAGVLCTKVSRYAERTYHPERLLHPLKRIGPKGSGQWETVSWDSALADIAARLGEIASRGPERILPYSYAGTMGHIQGESIAARFFHALGASQLDRTVCSSAGSQALAATYGGKLGMHLGDFAHAKLILIWGSNSITSNLHFWRIAQEAKRQGATLVCIDPRRTETAEKCQRHLAIRPGTDGALALALMHELFAKGWTDSAYMDAHVNGWEKLRDRAADWTPERAAAVCGVPAEEIRWLAEAYAQTRPAAIRLNYGMQRVAGGGNAVRLIALLPCLTGAWRERGGGLLLSSSGWAKGVRNDAQLQRAD
ncbi:MAG: molybdopterin-dependent oxidoreductase, partial [Gammaproteobacteria bacterium]